MFMFISCVYAATDLSSFQNVNLYTYKELDIATERFSPANKIGEGGFGSVYKVIALVWHPQFKSASLVSMFMSIRCTYACFNIYFFSG